MAHALAEARRHLSPNDFTSFVKDIQSVSNVDEGLVAMLIHNRDTAALRVVYVCDRRNRRGGSS